MFLKSLEDITYDDIISVENLLAAWEEFLRGKRRRKDVLKFQIRLMDYILDLHHELQHKTYVHGNYEAFNISDPKPRHIHKATVRDRLLHHAVYRVLYPSYDKTFIAHSYSCRRNKGTHRALNSFTSMARKVSKNHTKTVWVLKCDIKKFFASIDQEILIAILESKISDQCIQGLLKHVIVSFHVQPGKGLPLGNLTSQLLVNIYMNEFDQWMKHSLKARYYIRYADDFAVLSQDRDYLEDALARMHIFLDEHLKLSIHPKKVSITTFASGVDFLGWVHFPHQRVLRTVTKRRVFKRIQGWETDLSSIQSYLGLLSHGDTYKLCSRFPALQELRQKE